MTTSPDTIDVEGLESLARAATGDVWLHVEGERISHCAEGWETWAVLPSVVDLMTGDPVIDDAEHIDPRDRAFIAAANPATILALLATLRKQRHAGVSLLAFIDELDAYQKRPNNGEWGVECACCMGELIDRADSIRIDEARQALSTQPEVQS